MVNARLPGLLARYALPALFVWSLAGLPAVEPLPTTIEFNRGLRPFLSDTCFRCHGPDQGKRKAYLRLDTEAGARADLVQTTGGPTADEKLTLAFRLVTGCPPRPAEVQVLRAGLEHHLAAYRKDGAAARKLVSSGARPRDEQLEGAEFAAYMAMAGLILNLNEAITKVQQTAAPMRAAGTLTRKASDGPAAGYGVAVSAGPAYICGRPIVITCDCAAI